MQDINDAETNHRPINIPNPTGTQDLLIAYDDEHSLQFYLFGQPFIFDVNEDGSDAAGNPGTPLTTSGTRETFHVVRLNNVRLGQQFTITEA